MKRVITPHPQQTLVCRAVGAQPGQSMVELALVLGILLMLVFGGIGGIQVLLTNYTVERAARAAAHQAAIDGGWTAQAQASAAAVLDGAPWTSGGSRTITGGCGGPCRRYSPIVVAITYTDRLWVPVPFFGNVTANAGAIRAAEQDQGASSLPSLPGGSLPPMGGGPGSIPGPGVPSPAPQAAPQAAPLGSLARCPLGGCR